MKIFRRSSNKHSRKESSGMPAGSQSMVVNDANRDFLNDSANLAHIVDGKGEEFSYIDLVKKNRHLTEQNSHLNLYIT